jgi:hypothetical protein
VTPDRVSVIVNPAAGRGRGARTLSAVTAAFGAIGVTDIQTTKAQGFVIPKYQPQFLKDPQRSLVNALKLLRRQHLNRGKWVA